MGRPHDAVIRGSSGMDTGMRLQLLQRQDQEFPIPMPAERELPVPGLPDCRTQAQLPTLLLIELNLRFCSIHNP